MSKLVRKMKREKEEQGKLLQIGIDLRKKKPSVAERRRKRNGGRHGK
ncbi:MAG: hypothetical protein PHO67_07785 [Candidatus Omnitrophica bacterium]|nr:hypothetical protein [Candidatus Omnitrophota bacterium]